MEVRDTSQRTLFSVEELVALPEFGYLTKSSLRHMLFNSRERYSSTGEKFVGNGLVEAGAIIRIGRKLLIDAERFRDWIANQREKSASA